MVTIAVLEDDELFRTIIGNILLRHHYRSHLYESAEKLFSPDSGLETSDLLLLDIQLPDANGVDILRKLKTDPIYADLPVFMITADDKDATLETCLLIGACDYLVKPFEELKLIARIRAALERSGRFKQLAADIVNFKNETKTVSEKNHAYEERIHNLEMLHDELSSTTQHLAAATWRERKQKDQLNSTLSELSTALDELSKSRAQVEQSRKRIVDSINYAKKIQSAFLPDSERIKDFFSAAFVVYEPKDIVSGDFYWCEKVGTKKLIGAFDCTGHGVPGAFMSMIGMSLLNEIVGLRKILSPDKILSELHDRIFELLKQHRTDNKDGMDATLCCIDTEERVVHFCGATNPVIYFKDNTCHVLKGTRLSVGGRRFKNETSFELHELSLDDVQEIYLFSDGLQDQFGGIDSRKLGIRKITELLSRIHTKPMDEQEHYLRSFLQEWMLGGESIQKQIDDILFIGLRL